MKSCQFLYRAVLLAMLGCAVGPAAHARGDFIYLVTADTSSIAGTDGYLDFQFNQGDSTSEVATAVIQNYMQTGGSLANTSIITDDAAGVLPGTLTFDNGTIYNDVFQGVNFGSQITFQVTLSGDAVNKPGGTFGTTFAFSLYNADGDQALLTTDSTNGSLVTISINPDRSTQVLTYAAAPATVDVEPLNATPAPSSLALLLSTWPAGLILWRRGRGARTSVAD